MRVAGLLPAARLAQVCLAEVVRADPVQRRPGEAVPGHAPEVVPVRAEREEVRGPLLVRGQGLERAPLLGDPVSGSVDGDGEGGGAGSEARDEGDEGEGAEEPVGARPDRDPSVEERVERVVGEATDEAGRFDDESL